MSETLLFLIPPPDAFQDPATIVHWYQSTDGNTWGTVIDTVAVSILLVDTATGKLKWTSALADPAKYHQLKTESSAGIVSSFGAILPPKLDNPDMCMISVDVRSHDMVAVQKYPVAITPRTQALNGIIFDGIVDKVETGVNGRVTFVVAKGGVYDISLGTIKKTIDTTGKTFINVAETL